MAIEIFMPALSPTMETGTLAKWMVKEGDSVANGDIIAEIETDKATMEVESIDDGVVAKLLVADGTDDVPVGTIIAILAEEDEDVAAALKEAPKVVAASPEAAPKAVETAPTPLKAVAPSPKDTMTSDSRIKASPLAKRLAAGAGIDLKTVTGTGPYGRIIKRDIESYASPSAAAPMAAASTAAVGDAPYREERLSNMRKTIARRLTESKQSVPHFYLTVDCQLDKLLAARADINAGLADEGIKISVNDFVIKATAMALKKVPAANVQFAGDTMRWYERADISVAVAIEGGLITPVVRGACVKSLSAISTEVRDLAGRAKDGKLTPDEYSGGTFSISNLGMFGIREFSAVINPPEGAILAIGAGEKRPIVGADGALTVATVMTCTMSCDHRAIDGAVGAEFLKAFKGFLENPLTMLI